MAKESLTRENVTRNRVMKETGRMSATNRRSLKSSISSSLPTFGGQGEKDPKRILCRCL